MPTTKPEFHGYITLAGLMEHLRNYHDMTAVGVEVDGKLYRPVLAETQVGSGIYVLALRPGALIGTLTAGGDDAASV